MKIGFRAILLAGVLSTLTYASANAVIILDTFGSGDTYQGCCGYAVSGPTSSAPGWSTQGFSFTSPVSGILSDLAFGLTLDSGTNAMDIHLMSDSSGAPGAILETFHFTGMGDYPGVYTPLTATGTTSLLAGTSYWLIGEAYSDTFAVWNYSPAIGNIALATSNDGGSSWQIHPNEIHSPAARLEVTPRPTEVPEPGTLGLLGIGLAGLTLVRHRRHA